MPKILIVLSLCLASCSTLTGLMGGITCPAQARMRTAQADGRPFKVCVSSEGTPVDMKCCVDTATTNGGAS